MAGRRKIEYRQKPRYWLLRKQYDDTTTVAGALWMTEWLSKHPGKLWMRAADAERALSHRDGHFKNQMDRGWADMPSAPFFRCEDRRLLVLDVWREAQWVSAKDAADYIGTTVNWLRDYAAPEKLTPSEYRPYRNTVCYKIDEVMRIAWWFKVRTWTVKTIPIEVADGLRYFSDEALAAWVQMYRSQLQGGTVKRQEQKARAKRDRLGKV
jgi:hypothetical protein